MKDELVQRCVAKIHVIRITVSLMHQDLGQRDQRTVGRMVGMICHLESMTHSRESLPPNRDPQHQRIRLYGIKCTCKDKAACCRLQKEILSANALLNEIQCKAWKRQATNSRRIDHQIPRAMDTHGIRWKRTNRVDMLWQSIVTLLTTVCDQSDKLHH